MTIKTRKQKGNKEIGLEGAKEVIKLQLQMSKHYYKHFGIHYIWLDKSVCTEYFLIV